MSYNYDSYMMSFDEIDNHEYDDYSGPIELYGLDGFDYYDDEEEDYDDDVIDDEEDYDDYDYDYDDDYDEY